MSPLRWIELNGSLFALLACGLAINIRQIPFGDDEGAYRVRFGTEELVGTFWNVDTAKSAGIALAARSLIKSLAVVLQA